MKGKILVAYYSYSGNTRNLATLIAKKIKGDLAGIVSQAAYPAEYHAVVEQVKKELEAGYRPSIKSEINDLEEYNTIFVGTPNWWSTVVPPMQAFLESYNFAGKRIIPFCTHGGGGAGYIEKTIKRLCPQANVLPIFASYASSIKESDLDQWLQKNNLLVE